MTTRGGSMHNGPNASNGPNGNSGPGPLTMTITGEPLNPNHWWRW